jgi:transcriptional regulator with GAF, ATPase, and Fis domain
MCTNECNDTIPFFINSQLNIIEASRFLLEYHLETSPVADKEGSIIGMINRTQLLDVIARGLSPETLIKEIIITDPQYTLEHVDKLASQNKNQYIKMANSKNIIIHSEKMHELMKMVIHIASVDTTVLIQGESGFKVKR